jgi:hypothetical protein
MGNSKKAPGAPKKAPPKRILPSSRYYTTSKENNLTRENIENVEEVNLTALVEEAKKYPGNKPIPFHHPQLNLPVPKLKLPAHLQGGKTRRRRLGKKKSTRKH